jgi:hypothetical protein
MYVARQTIQLRNEDRALEPASISQGGGELRTTIQGIGSLPRFPLPVNSKAVFMERLLDLCGAEGEGTGGECGCGSGWGSVQLSHAGRLMAHCRVL